MQHDFNCVENVVGTALETLGKIILCACVVMPEDLETKPQCLMCLGPFCLYLTDSFAFPFLFCSERLLDLDSFPEASFKNIYS